MLARVHLFAHRTISFSQGMTGGVGGRAQTLRVRILLMSLPGWATLGKLLNLSVSSPVSRGGGNEAMPLLQSSSQALEKDNLAWTQQTGGIFLPLLRDAGITFTSHSEYRLPQFSTPAERGSDIHIQIAPNLNHVANKLFCPEQKTCSSYNNLPVVHK